MFTLHKRSYLCIVDYHSKFPVIKTTEDISADSLILTCKIIYSEYGLPKKIISDSGGNFISDKFTTFCRSLQIHQAFSSSYNHLSNGQVEACIKLIKKTLKNALILNLTTYSFISEQINPIKAGLPSSATLLFNHPIRGIMSTINRPLIGINNNDEQYEALVKRQTKTIRTMILPEIMLSLQ